ncbi:hypothetical protein [Photorhabdus sp. CRCIA-P01]|uniref:hypothetical protein n=1 Tax=Photorhabdus sp. CRCIA-P01 TaxID=2019570 RepID=UPI0013003335|nr:hypothetical protein [Photorhabdus sp. CRCIA-P01]
MTFYLTATDPMDSILLSLNSENSQVRQTGYTPWGGRQIAMIPSGGTPGFNGERITR